MAETVPVNRPLVTEEDVAAVTNALRAGWISGDAPLVSEFENAFADSLGLRHGIAVPNGSLAIDLVISALNIGPGDEVILPTLTIISCVTEILRRGGQPVFVDADPVTWNMDVNSVEALISPRTRLILAVHVYGLPVDMDPLVSLAEKRGIPIIEDAAEAHGLWYRGRQCGSMGFASTYSFYANKNVTTGEGGMICTDDESLATRLRYLRNLAFQAGRRFIHADLGWNMRFTAIQAALGLSQLARLGESVSKRRAIAARYRERLAGVNGVTFQPAQTDYATNSYWVVGVTLDSEAFGEASKIRYELEQHGVGTRPFFYPLHQQPVYLDSKSYLSQELPVADSLSKQGLYFPNGLGLSDQEMAYCVETVGTVLEGYN